MNKSCPRVLALDVHARHAGFAALEGSDRLIDWGLLYFANSRTQPARGVANQLARLISRCRPGWIVVTMPANQTLARERLHEIGETVARLARQSGIRLCEMPRQQVLEALGARTRYAAALQVAERFPALGARLPKRRKIWQSEQARMSTFDATAAGIAFYRERQRRARRTARRAA